MYQQTIVGERAMKLNLLILLASAVLICWHHWPKRAEPPTQEQANCMMRSSNFTPTDAEIDAMDELPWRKTMLRALRDHPEIFEECRPVRKLVPRGR